MYSASPGGKEHVLLRNVALSSCFQPSQSNSIKNCFFYLGKRCKKKISILEINTERHFQGLRERLGLLGLEKRQILCMPKEKNINFSIKTNKQKKPHTTKTNQNRSCSAKQKVNIIKMDQRLQFFLHRLKFTSCRNSAEGLGSPLALSPYTESFSETSGTVHRLYACPQDRGIFHPQYTITLYESVHYITKSKS